MVLLLTAISAWTNTAGRVITAEPVRLSESSIELRLANGRTRSLPWGVFPASEQARLRASLGLHDLPADLGALRATFAADLRRAEQRHAGGVLSDEDFRAKRARVLAAWAKALADAKLSAEELDFWKGNLK